VLYIGLPIRCKIRYLRRRAAFFFVALRRRGRAGFFFFFRFTPRVDLNSNFTPAAASPLRMPRASAALLAVSVLIRAMVPFPSRVCVILVKSISLKNSTA
jgi:hypothetical protein